MLIASLFLDGLVIIGADSFPGNAFIESVSGMYVFGIVWVAIGIFLLGHAPLMED